MSNKQKNEIKINEEELSLFKIMLNDFGSSLNALENNYNEISKSKNIKITLK